MSATAIAAPSEDPKEELRQLRRDFERLKDRLDEIERQEPPPFREESGNEMAHLLGPRHSTIPHIETPDSEEPALTVDTKTIERTATGWRWLNSDSASGVKLDDGDLLAALQSAANSGTVPTTIYTTISQIVDVINEGDNPITNTSPEIPGENYSGSHKGPFEIYDVNILALTVKLYGAGGLAGQVEDDDDPAGYRNDWQGLDIGVGLLSCDFGITIGPSTGHIYLKYEIDNTTTPLPPFAATIELLQGANFPNGSDNVVIIPLWYVPLIYDADLEQYIIDSGNIERWISAQNLPQVS